MPEPPAGTFEPTPWTARWWTAGAMRSGPSSSQSASGNGSRPLTLSEFRTSKRRRRARHPQSAANLLVDHADLDLPSVTSCQAGTNLRLLYARIANAYVRD